MPWKSDALLDRIRLKQQIRKWRVLAIIALIISAVVIANQFMEDPLLKTGGSYIARINVSGLIEEDVERSEILDNIAKNDRIKAVIVHVNSPGGTVVGGESLYNDISRIAEFKPVTTVMGTLSTSAGYLVALAGDHIFARKGSLTGSIGVILQSAEITDLAEKLGIDFQIIKSSELKGQPSPFEEMTPEARKAAQEVINSFYNVFIDIVAKERNLDREAVLNVADGRVFTGKQALDYKLVDAIGGEREAVSWLVETKGISDGLDVKEVALHPEESKLDKLFDKYDFIGSAESLVPKRFLLQGLLSIW